MPEARIASVVEPRKWRTIKVNGKTIKIAVVRKAGPRGGHTKRAEESNGTTNTEEIAAWEARMSEPEEKVAMTSKLRFTVQRNGARNPYSKGASTYRKTSESISILCLSLLILLIHRVTRISGGG